MCDAPPAMKRVRYASLLGKNDNPHLPPSSPVPVFINVYHRSQQYGGPEEGGWWYTQDTIHETYNMTGLPASIVAGLAMALHDAYEIDSQDVQKDFYSVNGGGIWKIKIENQPGRDTPSSPPHYE